MNKIKENGISKLVLFVILIWSSTITLSESAELFFKYLMFRMEWNPMIIFFSTKIVAISIVVCFVLICIHFIKKYERFNKLLLFSLLLYVVSFFITFFIGDILPFMSTESAYKQFEIYKSFLFSNSILAYANLLINSVTLIVLSLIFLIKR